MARAFSDEEKRQIQQTLLDTGRELFLRYGLKKTTIEDLTQPAGIAKSSFYTFFDSKEALYLELLMMQGPEIEERILSSSFHATDDMREAIARFIRAVIDEIESNELTRRLVTNHEDLELLARRLSPEMREAKTQRSRLPILPFVRQGQAAGQIIDGEPEVIAGVIRAVTLLTLHRDDIGEEVYPEMLDMLIDLVAAGLTDNSKGCNNDD
jgi:AcrR family transcriptional regulator